VFFSGREEESVLGRTAVHRLTWYRQKRVDGGVRTAIDVDDVTLFHLFENVSDQPDPVLLWYVDLRCTGARLPVTPPAVREWLLGQAPVVRAGLVVIAEEVRAGVDAGIWPFRRELTGLPGRVKATLVYCAARRQDRLDLADILTDVAGHWEERIQSLPVVEAARAS
jgi:hypothetical protein